MNKLILIKDIKIDRELAPDDDLADVIDVWPARPIVVEGDRLIDGLRRVRAAERRGEEEVLALDPQTLEEASEALSMNHQRPATWQRIHDMYYGYLDRLINERLILIRQRGAYKRHRNESWNHIGPFEPSRDLLQRAFGGVSSNQWEKLFALYKAEQYQLIQAVHRGELSPAAAYARFRGQNDLLKGSITDTREQTDLLLGSTQAIRTTINALQRLSRPITVDPDVMGTIMEDLYKARGKLAGIIHQLEEAVSK